MKSILKPIIALVIISLSFQGLAQNKRINPHTHERCNHAPKTDWFPSEDPNYDVHFYHIQTQVAIDSIWMSGKVRILVSSNIDGLNSMLVDLDQTFEIENISAPVTDYTFSDNVIEINLENSYNIGDTLSFTIEYSGYPQMPGGYKGLRYETHDNGEPIIATLSTPYLAHSWYPCKDGTTDKADSVYIDITVKDTIISDIPVMALSNGLLENTYSDGTMKTFEWRHRYPIVPYYVMMAISNYTMFQQEFDNGVDAFPIDYYVFESHLSTAQQGVENLPDAMALFSDLFGPYPFKDEKYGMTQLGYYGGIENQTNSIVNNMSASWFDVSVHELAHMWFADDITCENWHHGWVNEGFASYSEALYHEHAYGMNAYHSYVQEFSFKEGGTLYLEDVSDPFYGVFQSIIYNKGAYVLHMLRGVLGDEIFFDCIYEYATNENFRQGWANTEDFQNVCEEVSGEDLEYFFQQWIYQERYPKYRYNFSSSMSQTSVVLQQSQGLLGWPDLFTMPLQIQFHFEDGSDSLIRVVNDEIEEQFNFNFEQEVIDVDIDPDKWILRDVTFDDGIFVGIEESKRSTFAIFPNPNKGSFRIQLNTENFKESQIRIINAEGKLIRKFESITSSYFEIESLPKGIYFIEVSNQTTSYKEKIVVI
jgi:aminopeptidase N